ncbi:MAG: amino acid adenylation domain-containing protein [Gemmatimonadetes bacterium]|nr:amino acid adenylation domain-containing protein [Gemmatimonadota bacterium]
MTDPTPESRADALRRAIRRKRDAAPGARPKTELPRRPPETAALLGGMQRSLRILHRLAPGSAAYNLVSAHRVAGSIDPDRLSEALSIVVARHRILRSTFVDRDGEVVQVIHPPGPFRVDVIDGERAEDAAVRAARVPFDLEHGPLIRMHLARGRSPEDRILALSLHHIVADEPSLEIFWRQLADAFEGREVVEPPVQYDDYVHWRSRETGAARSEELGFWTERLHPPPASVELPFERSGRGPTESGRSPGRIIRRALPTETHRSVAALAASAGTTPFSAYAMAFRLLLQRYLPGRDIAFGTPATTRSHPATADMIGYFLNPVVVPTPVDERAAAIDELRSFGRDVRALLSHSSLPFADLVERVSHERAPDRHPFFQVMLVHQRQPDAWSMGDLRLEPLELDLGESKFDLTLFVSEVGDAVRLGLEYRTDRFAAEWMERLLDHYRRLIQALGERPDRPCGELEMLGDEERGALFSEWQGDRLGATDDAFLPQRVLDRSERSPEATAIVWDGETWSYRRLAETALVIAERLTESGVGPGDRVGIYLDRSPWLIAGILGTLSAGAAYVPLDPSYPARRNRTILEDADVAVVLHARERPPGGESRALHVETLEIGPDALGASVDAPRIGDPDARRAVSVDAATPAYVLHTSGSTGRPKGVVVGHGNLARSTDARLRFYGGGPGRFLLIPSIAFDSSVAGLFWTLASGGTLVVPTDDEAEDPRRLVELIATRNVTGLLCVPSLYARLLDIGGERLRGLRTAIVAGEPCLPGVVRTHFDLLPDAELVNEYGPTEATVWATAHRVTPGDADRRVPIGRPIPGVRVHLRDPAGRPVPVGIPGEAWIAGGTVAAGYWRRASSTAERFVTAELEPGAPERLYRTGDRMAWTLEGELEFLGRVDDQLTLRGFRIEPGEIEAALSERPDIEEAVVVARSPAGSGAAGPGGADPRRLVAFVLSGEVPDREAWNAHLSERLPRHMVPRRYVALPELPRLPNGKVDRRALREMPIADEASASEPAEAASDAERALLALWEGLLGRDGIGVDDNFFELGGHSLLVVEMVTALERDFGVVLSPPEAFQHPTVRELADRIRTERAPGLTEYSHLFPIQPTGRGDPFVMAVPHFFSSALANRFRAERPVYGLRGVSLREGGNSGRWPSMTDLARELVEEVVDRFPDREYTVAGYSFGASMAHEMVRQMEEAGLPVDRLIMIAPMPLDHFGRGPLRFQVGGLDRPPSRLSLSEAVVRSFRYGGPLSGRFLPRARWLLATRPWRRLLSTVGRLRRGLGLPLTPRILDADVRAERFRLHRAFRPAPIRTPTVFFNPVEPDTDAAATWRPCFAGPLEVVDFPDPHLGEPFVGRAQDIVLRHLGEPAESGGSPETISGISRPEARPRRQAP